MLWGPNYHFCKFIFCLIFISSLIFQFSLLFAYCQQIVNIFYLCVRLAILHALWIFTLLILFPFAVFFIFLRKCDFLKKIIFLSKSVFLSIQWLFSSKSYSFCQNCTFIYLESKICIFFSCSTYNSIWHFRLIENIIILLWMSSFCVISIC